MCHGNCDYAIKLDEDNERVANANDYKATFNSVRMENKKMYNFDGNTLVKLAVRPIFQLCILNIFKRP